MENIKGYKSELLKKDYSEERMLLRTIDSSIILDTMQNTAKFLRTGDFDNSFKTKITNNLFKK